MGPTASGKTALALELINNYPIEIISVDSALIYKDMNIGTAKPTTSELSSVTHHLIDIITPLESYSVAQFLTATSQIIRDVIARNKSPVLVGGTMMYYNALLNGISILPEANFEIRNQLEQRIQINGLNTLYNELLLIDSSSAQRININDKQRIIRALEVYYISGIQLSELQKQNHVNLLSDISFLPLAIIPNDRSLLHERINQRSVNILSNGFIEEVAQLREIYPYLTANHTAMRCVGYSEVWQYLDGIIELEELYNKVMASTRQLAKRQITWLRSISHINLLQHSYTHDSLYNELIRQIDQFGVESRNRGNV
ncbi:MAG: tRNA (adenosine(37)-N6)-dimethylallyltransferase MiaA [Burkholderiales bacterium]|nr:tRNA (adenosine(37)-N6)-dimethylallyltransferase MiaA [Burkholderiales bacterium]